MQIAIDKNLTLVAGISSLLALGSAFETFTTLALFWRLLITSVAAASVAMAVANRLAIWSRQSSAVPGFGREDEALSINRLLGSATLLALVCAAFVWLAWFQTDRFVLRIQESRSADFSNTLLHAPSRPVNRVTIQLPGPGKNDCKWSDQRTDSFPRLRVQTIDWDTPIRKLRVDNFVYPQVVGIECRPAVDVASRVYAEPLTEVFLAGELKNWQHVIFVLGGLTWVVAVWRLFSSAQ